MPELSPENRGYLDAALSAGVYSNEGAALDEAVQLLRRRDEARKKLQAAVDQADSGELMAASEVFARLEARAASIEQRGVAK
jgi:hypothetical protein